MAPGRKKSATASREWSIGDLVLAKVRGYPAWPAKVSSPGKHKLSPKASKVFVEFFGTKDHGFVSSAEVSEFTPEVRVIILKKARYTGSGSYRAAVKEICKVSDKRGNRRAESEEETSDEEEEVPSSPCGSDEKSSAPEQMVAGEGEDVCVDVTDAMDCGEVVDERSYESTFSHEAESVKIDPMHSFACLAMAAETVLIEGEAIRLEKAEGTIDKAEELADRPDRKDDKDEEIVASRSEMDEAEKEKNIVEMVNGAGATGLAETEDEAEATEMEDNNAKAAVEEDEAEVTAVLTDIEDNRAETAFQDVAEGTAVLTEIDSSKAAVQDARLDEAAAVLTEKADGVQTCRYSPGEKEIEPPVTCQQELDDEKPSKVLVTYERRRKNKAKSARQKVLKTFERRKKRIEQKAELEKTPKNVEKKTLKRALSSKLNEELEERKVTKKLKQTNSNNTGALNKRMRKEEASHTSKRPRTVKSPAKGDGEREAKKQTRAVQPSNVKDAKAISHHTLVTFAAPTKLLEADTNDVRKAVEAAKELRQRLAQKEESVSASVKFLQVAAKNKMHTASSSRESPLFMRPDKASPSRHRNEGDKSVSFSKKEGSTVDSFQATLETLTGTQESILKATRHAMRCANKGFGKKVMHIIMQKLKHERDHRKRIDLLFLVESMTRGISGSEYARIVEGCLARFLSAVAPPNSPVENHRQCVKVVSLWLKRKSMQESVLTDLMAKLEAGLNTRKRQHERQDRAIDDPVREMDDMLVDEYGSNTGFSLPGLLVRQIDDEEEDGEAAAPLVQQRDSPEDKSHTVVMEDLDGELDMEDVRVEDMNVMNRKANGSSASSSLTRQSLTRHDDDEEEQEKQAAEAEADDHVPLPPASSPPSPPPLPESPPPSPPPRPPTSPSPHSNLKQHYTLH